MNNLSANLAEVDMQLTQMGAKVTNLHGLVSFIQFNLEQTELFYVYNINRKNQFFLQMVKPFSTGAGVFHKPQDIVQYIKNDLKQFKNASNSNVFPEFINVNQALCSTIRDIKDIFMTYNVPRNKMLQIKEKIDEISALLDGIKRTSDTL